MAAVGTSGFIYNVTPSETTLLSANNIVITLFFFLEKTARQQAIIEISDM